MNQYNKIFKLIIQTILIYFILKYGIPNLQFEELLKIIALIMIVIIADGYFYPNVIVKQ
jgi:hypothetical protein